MVATSDVADHVSCLVTGTLTEDVQLKRRQRTAVPFWRKCGRAHGGYLDGGGGGLCMEQLYQTGAWPEVQKMPTASPRHGLTGDTFLSWE